MEYKFYDGLKVKVMTKLPHGNVLVKAMEDYHLDQLQMFVGTECSVPENSLQPLVSEEFAVGDRVRSKRKHCMENFTGRIVGFEMAINSAICVSDKIAKYTNDRTRYSYHISAIEIHDPQYMKWEPGKWYKINKDQNMMAVQHTGDPVLLVNEQGIVCHIVPRNSFRPRLAIEHDIHTVEILK